MPAGVRLALQEAVKNHGGKTDEEAKEFVAAMERDGKLIEDCWD